MYKRQAQELAARLDKVAPVILAVSGRVPETAYDWAADTKTLSATTPPDLMPPKSPKFDAVLAQWSRDRAYVRALRAALNTPVAKLKVLKNRGEATPATKDDLLAIKEKLHEYEAMLADFEYELRHHPDIVKAVAHHNGRFVDMP